jgi:hypothetical protein
LQHAFIVIFEFDDGEIPASDRRFENEDIATPLETRKSRPDSLAS